LRIKISVIDDNGINYEGQIELKPGKPAQVGTTEQEESTEFRPGTTAEKIINLFNEGFFEKNRTISDIVNELKSRDYHYKSTDLTLPLRRIVRKQILKKTKELSDEKKSKQWTYVES